MNKRWMTACGGAAVAGTLLVTAPESKAQTAPQRVEITGTAIKPAEAIALDAPAAAGSRLGLTLMETPASVDVVSRELMRERGDRTTQQALENAAGVVTGQCFGLTCFSLRGFSNNLSVPYLFNGVRYPGLAYSPRGTFVFERIEVIKGPSSVLHGLGSVGGSVNFVTKVADGKSEREVLLATDRWGTANVGLGVGGQASEDMAYRVDVNAINGRKGSAGWVDRSSYDYLHGAAEWAWNLTRDFKLTLSGQALRDSGEWYFGTPLVSGKIDERVRFNNYNASDNNVSKSATWLRVNADYTLSGKLKLRNETYYNKETRFYRNAETYSYNAGTGKVDLFDFLNIKHDQKLAGNRTELSNDDSLLGIRHRWVFGVDLSNNKHQRTNNSPYSSPDVAVDFLAPVPVVFNTTSAYSPQRQTNLDQQAVFAESLLDVTKATKLSLSARYDKLKLDSFDLRGNTSFSKDYKGSSWRVGVLQDLAADITVYAQVSRALEPPAQIVTLTAAQQGFNLTRARQAEAGVKGYLPGRIGEFTLAYFDIVRTDILTRDPVSPALIVQIGQQSSHGFEWDFSVRPAPGWTLGFNGTVLKAQFDNFNESVAGKAVSRAGLLPPDTPERVANVFVAWRATDTLRLNGTVRHVGQRTVNNANTVFMDAYTTADVGAIFRLPMGELGLRLRNVGDKVYGSRSYGATQVLLGEPRAWELSYNARF